MKSADAVPFLCNAAMVQGGVFWIMRYDATKALREYVPMTRPVLEVLRDRGANGAGQAAKWVLLGNKGYEPASWQAAERHPIQAPAASPGLGKPTVLMENQISGLVSELDASMSPQALGLRYMRCTESAKTLGRIGIYYALPAEAVKALVRLEKDDTEFDSHESVVGRDDKKKDGSVRRRLGDASRIVFLRWELTRLERVRDRMWFLWDQYVENAGDAVILRFCVDEWGKLGTPETMPFLCVAAATPGETCWAVRLSALEALAGLGPGAGHVLAILKN
jgi:hypothetical protein